MRLALVSGGSRGLGAELYRLLVERGDHVVEFSRSAPHAHSVATDFSDPEASRRTIAAALAALPQTEWEEIVVIANAATIEPIGPTSRQDPSALLKNLNGNIVAPILFITEAVARFQSQACRKTLVNISSGAATRGQAGVSLYCAAKAGLDNYIRAVALEQELEAAPFTAITVDPGAMDTAMQQSILDAPVDDFPDLDRFVQRARSGSLRVPAKVAAAVLRIVALPDLAQAGRHNAGDHGA